MEKQPIFTSERTLKNIQYPSTWTYVVVLIAICFISINNYFCYHEPSAIALEFEEFYHIDTRQFGTLFTIYSAPNVVLVFFSGQFIDTYGLKRSSILFNSLILVSMLLGAITPSPSDNAASFWTPRIVYLCLLLSRLLLGLGGESICACVSTMISRWFASTQHLNTAMALNQASVQLFGSAAAFYILPHAQNIVTSRWITVAVCLISLLANLFYNHYETLYDAFLDDVNQVTTETNLSIEKKHGDGKDYQSIPTIHQDEAEKAEIPPSDEFSNENIFLQSYRVLLKFPTLFWLILLHISLVSPILYTFTAFGPMYLQETFAATKTATAAGEAISLLYMSIVAAPFTGMIIDRIGYRSYVQFIASFNIPFLFVLLIYGWLDPKICMIWMGIIFSITESNGLALVSLVVPSELTGTAYGLYACCISFALLLEPAIVGLIRQMTGSFARSIWIFFSLTFLGSIVAVLVTIYDLRQDNLISKSATEISQQQSILLQSDLTITDDQL
jgi:MFS family permease